MALLKALLVAVLAGSFAAGPEVAQGPFLGHVGVDVALVWARLGKPGKALLEIARAGGGPWRVVAADARPEDDLCVVWRIEGLEPATVYEYAAQGPDGPVTGRFTTAPAPSARARVTVALGSCAREDEGTAGVWDRIARLAPDAVVLLGDTPYINSSDLAVQRRRYREFAAVPAMRRALAGSSFYATWDDHDFGRQDTDGHVPGKADVRRAFIEYHANPSYGDGASGIYTSFRRGPLEVFLLDTRWFARTEPSPFDPARPSLLGKAQWAWLQERLTASDAPFKVLACGMVWNGAVRPGKPDYWGAYRLERRALFELIGRRRIGGVVLVGGDIHRSRVIRHATKRTCGYDLTELITSPMHDGVIGLAAIPHLGLIKDMGEPHAFLLLEADSTTAPPRLEARFMNAAGDVLFAFTTSAEALRAEASGAEPLNPIQDPARREGGPRDLRTALGPAARPRADRPRVRAGSSGPEAVTRPCRRQAGG